MLSQFDLKIVKRLAKLSELNDVQLRCSHVAALFHKKKLLSLGMNKTKTHPLAFKLSGLQSKRYLHAEIDCLKAVEGELSKATLYVVRVDRNGELANSKPCKYCMPYIQEKQIGRVVYTVDGGIRESC